MTQTALDKVIELLRNNYAGSEPEVTGWQLDASTEIIEQDFPILCRHAIQDPRFIAFCKEQDRLKTLRRNTAKMIEDACEEVRAWPAWKSELSEGK